MKLHPGKQYKTRGGETVVCLWCGSFKAMVAFVDSYDAFNKAYAREYMVKSEGLLTGPLLESTLDIIGPAVVPTVKRCIYILFFEQGSIAAVPEELMNTHHLGMKVSARIKIAVEYREGQFDD